jgi:hypothetical protein
VDLLHRRHIRNDFVTHPCRFDGAFQGVTEGCIVIPVGRLPCCQHLRAANIRRQRLDPGLEVCFRQIEIRLPRSLTQQDLRDQILQHDAVGILIRDGVAKRGLRGFVTRQFRLEFFDGDVLAIDDRRRRRRSGSGRLRGKSGFGGGCFEVPDEAQAVTPSMRSRVKTGIRLKYICKIIPARAIKNVGTRRAVSLQNC